MTGLVMLVLLLCLGFLAFSHRFGWWRKTTDWQHPRILMYHMVREHIPSAKFNKLRVTPRAFEQQLHWLSTQGFHFFTMQELRALWKAGQLPAKSVAITFDDGYEDNLINALPLLQKYQAKATIYVVVDRHDNDWATYKKAHHNNGELMREPKLSDLQVQALVDSGCIEIGSHTMTHVNLGKLNDEKLRLKELTESRTQLQLLTGQPVESFAYPFGIYGQADVETARAAGYQDAVTVAEGIDPAHPLPDFLQLKRIKISGKDTLLAFRIRLRTGKRGWK